MSSVDVSDKSNDGIQKSLNQIYIKFGVPVGYTSEQLTTELVKNPFIMQVNQSLLNLLVDMNKLQEDNTQKSKLDLAIKQFTTGNIVDKLLINELSYELLKHLPNEQLQPGSVVNLEGVKKFLTNSGISDSVIIIVEQIISSDVDPPPASSSSSASSSSAPLPAAHPRYMQPTAASSSSSAHLPAAASSPPQHGGDIVIISIIAVGLLILVIATNKDKISNTVLNILNCFSFKSSSGGKKSKRMQNKSKRHRKSRRQRKSKRRQ
jgi:hypothetical protein